MRTTIAFVLVAGSWVLAACGGEPDGGPADGGSIDGGGGSDGGPVDGGPGDAPDCTSDPTAEGCACGEPGVVMCMGAGGVECCHGEWHSFLDGPCRGAPDGGVISCGEPEAGCPCDTDGEIACRTFLRWRLVCEAGVWAEDHGRICC